MPIKVDNLTDYIKSRIVIQPDGCWLWKLKLHKSGYAACTYKYQPTYAHILSYKTFKGEIPDDLEIRHSCDVRHCVNPDHLLLGTHSDNMKDMVNRKRTTWTKLSDEDVLQIRKLCEMFSQFHVADLFGVQQSTISRIVNRKRRIHI